MKVCDICKERSCHTLAIDNGIENYDLCDKHYRELIQWIIQKQELVEVMPEEEAPPPPVKTGKRGRPRTKTLN